MNKKKIPKSWLNIKAVMAAHIKKCKLRNEPSSLGSFLTTPRSVPNWGRRQLRMLAVNSTYLTKMTMRAQWADFCVSDDNSFLRTDSHFIQLKEVSVCVFYVFTYWTSTVVLKMILATNADVRTKDSSGLEYLSCFSSEILWWQDTIKLSVWPCIWGGVTKPGHK